MHPRFDDYSMKEIYAFLRQLKKPNIDSNHLELLLQNTDANMPDYLKRTAAIPNQTLVKLWGEIVRNKQIEIFKTHLNTRLNEKGEDLDQKALQVLCEQVFINQQTALKAAIRTAYNRTEELAGYFSTILANLIDNVAETIKSATNSYCILPAELYQLISSLTYKVEPSSSEEKMTVEELTELFDPIDHLFDQFAAIASTKLPKQKFKN